VRVAVIVEQLLAPVPGGIGRYTRELTAALARSAGSGDQVHGWSAWHRDPAAAFVPGVAGPTRLALPRRPLTLAWEHGIGPAPRAADVVHAPSPLFPPPRGRGLVVSIHDTVPWTHPETLTPRGAHWHRLMARRAVDSGAEIGVLTAAVGHELLELLPGLSSDRVHRLGAGVADALRHQPDPARTAEVARRLALPERFVLTLATLEPRKGLDVLVAAAAALGPAAVPVLVVGQPGWGGVDLAATARAAGLGPDAVRVLGRLDDADLGVVLRAASVLVVPSRAEGFGLPVVEAMAVGTPVITSDVPALVEVAGAAAVVVPRGDHGELAAAIEAVLTDPGLRARLAAAGLVQAAGHTWEAVADRAWPLYRALAAAASR
jgi:glycosyltransferase involved in cell wall biosynthesis